MTISPVNALNSYQNSNLQTKEFKNHRPAYTPAPVTFSSNKKNNVLEVIGNFFKGFKKKSNNTLKSQNNHNLTQVPITPKEDIAVVTIPEGKKLPENLLEELKELSSMGDIVTTKTNNKEGETIINGIYIPTNNYQETAETLLKKYKLPSIAESEMKKDNISATEIYNNSNVIPFPINKK